MTDHPRPPTRRLAIGLLASLPAMIRAGRLAAAPSIALPAPLALTANPFPNGASLMVAGPEGGALDECARSLLPALARSLARGSQPRRIALGAADGVTGANQFDARVAPDGLTALLVPGTAALAWLAADERAQFDVGRWVSVMAAAVPGVLVARPGTLLPGRAVRIACSTMTGPDLPALLGIDLLGATAQPVQAAARQAALAAYSGDAVDAVFLQGHRVPQRLAAFAEAGARPAFTLGALDEAGRLVRSPLFPDVPHFGEAYATLWQSPAAGPLYAAWCATAAAARLDWALVLPLLTPAAMVALWRRAGSDAAASAEVKAFAQSVGALPLGATAATGAVGSLVGDPAGLLELRRWLASRFNRCSP